MRFLCLHGLGTNSEVGGTLAEIEVPSVDSARQVLEAQTASLRYRLGEGNHKFEFLNGSKPWPPARGIQEVFGQYIDCYTYFDGDGKSATSIRESVEDLADYVTAHGPFDGVIGFSQGAVLAATLIIAVEEGLIEMVAPFRCAIFLCGGLPFDYSALQRGVVTLLSPRDNSRPLIHLPVTNAWASNDTDYPGMGPPLSQLCARDHNWEVIHEAGHGVPAEGKDLESLVHAVTATTERARISESKTV